MLSKFHISEDTFSDVAARIFVIFLGREDLTRCHQCGIGLKDWGKADNPLSEHVRYSPDCQFLKDTIPSTRLSQIKVSDYNALRGLDTLSGETTR